MVRLAFSTKSAPDSGREAASLELRERRLAQVVREFMGAFVLAGHIDACLRDGTLDFAGVERLVGDTEGSVLFRLKEECHALFRVPEPHRSRTEVQADDLFDLAVGALFHEAMKFREGFYVSATYGPRLQQMIAEGGASSGLAEACRKVLDDGQKRMHESALEVWELFLETREHLLTVLRQRSGAGSVARSLVEDPERSEAVFGVGLRPLLADVYGDAERGLGLAIDNLLNSGHYDEASRALGRASLGDSPVCRAALPYAAGMAAYYSGDYKTATEQLEIWVEDGAPGPELRTRQTVRVLGALATSVEDSQPALAQQAIALAERLMPAHRR